MSEGRDFIMLERESKEEDWQQEGENDEIDLELNSFLDSELRLSSLEASSQDHVQVSWWSEGASSSSFF